MNGRGKLDFFTKWFRILAKHQMAGALMPICGMAVGFNIVQATRVTPIPFDGPVGFLGLYLMGASAFIFVLTMLGFSLIWLRNKMPKHRSR